MRVQIAGPSAASTSQQSASPAVKAEQDGVDQV